jgi:hypothetical protein
MSRFPFDILLNANNPHQINGWTPGVLANAMATCDIGESGQPLSDCFDVYTDDERNACTQAPFFDENIAGPLDALPGCNPIQAGPALATKAACSGEPAVPTGSASMAAAGNSTGNSTGTGAGYRAGNSTGTGTGTVAGHGAGARAGAGGSLPSGSAGSPPSSSSYQQGGSGGQQGGAGGSSSISTAPFEVAAAVGPQTVTITASRETVTMTVDLCSAASTSSSMPAGRARRVRRSS